MSLQQSKAEKNESQTRKLGRSSGAGHHQQTLKGAEVGGPGPHSSFNRSGKRANVPVGQSRGNSTAGHPQPNANPKIQNGVHTQRQQTGVNPTAGSSQPNVNVKSQNGGNTQRQPTGGNPTVGPTQSIANQKIQNDGHTQKQHSGGNPPVGPSQPNTNQKIQNGGHSQKQQPGLELSDTLGWLPSTATKKSNSLPPKVNGLLSKPPISLASNVNSSEESSSVTTVAVSGESTSAMVQQSFPLQFGSFSPLSVSELQVPARTCSAPPNFNEQKHDQARFSAANDVSVAKVPTALSGTQHQLELVSKQAASTLEPPVEGKRNLQEVKSEVSVVSTKQRPGSGISSALPVQSIHAPSSQMQPQCLTAGPAPLQLQLQVPSAVQSQVQQQIFGSQNLTANTLQPQQGIMHQVHGLSFPQTMGPPLTHIMSQQVNSMTSHIPSQQFPSLNPQNPYQINPQLGGSVGTRLSTYMPAPPTSQYIPQRTNMAVKITHPETHEELKFGPKGMKSDSQTDNNVVSSIKDSVPPSAALPTYRPPLSGSVSLSGSRPMNFYSSMPAGSYSNISSTFHQPLKTKTGISNDSRPLTGQNKQATIHSGEVLDILKPFPQASETTLAPVQVLDGKTNSLPETLGNESSSLAVAVVTSEDNCSLKFSIHPPSEVSAIDKAADGIKLLPVNITAVTACDLSDGTVSNSSVVSALDSGLNHHTSEKQKSISKKQAGLSTNECSNKMTKPEHKPKRQQMQKQVSLVGSSSDIERESKGEVVAEESKLSGSHRQAEELLLSQTSLSTSTAPLVAALQKTVKAVDGGANSEIAIETVLHSSLPEPESAAHPCGSFSNPTKCEKILLPKKSSGSMVNVVDTPSLRISGVSASVDEITERDISRGNSEPLHDSESVSELIIADMSSSMGSSGEGSEGKAETSGLVTEFSTKDGGVVRKTAEDMKFDNNTVLVGTLKSSTCSEDAIKSDSKLRNVKNKQSESTSDNARQSCSNIFVNSVIGEKQSLGNGLHPENGTVVVSDSPSVLSSSPDADINKELTYFANSVIGKEKASLHAGESKINEMHESRLASQLATPDNGTVAVDQNLLKEKKGEVLVVSEQSTADSGKVAEWELQSEATAVLPKAVMVILEEKTGFLSGNKVVDCKQSSGYRNKGRDNHDSAKVLGEGSAANVKATDTKDKCQVSTTNSDICEMSAQHQVSSLTVESEGKQDLVARLTEKENKSSSNVSVKNNVTNIGDPTKVIVNKKKKKKDLFSKANAAAPTGDLYNAYKVQEEKQEDVNPPEPSKVTDVVKSKTSSKEPEKEVLKEVDDWEDAAELSTPMNQVALLVTKCSGDRKYSRDFLLTIKDQCKDLPNHFEICPETIELLGNSQALGSHAGEADSLASTARGLDRQLSGNNRLERRGSNMGSLDDDRWAKPVDAFAAGRDVRMDAGLSGSSAVLRSGQGYNNGFARNTRAAQMNLNGILPGGPYVQAPFPQVGLVRNNSDADRWQRAKGLIPPPQPSLPTIHKSENRYEVGQVSDEDQLKQRQIKSILNKLTPQNFEKLFVQVKEVNIDSASCLHGIISQIFDKALMEPTFCEMYAKFCFQLAAGLPEFYEDDEKVVFKRVLLNKCQEEFEKDEREEAEAEKEEEHGEKNLSAEERREKKAAARRRMLGNIRFIGELYKESMLTERIMHACIKKLIGEFQHPEEENVEALCKLMSTIGHMIDHSKAKEHIDAYFDRMTKMSNNQALPSRLRFMLKDLIDLRKNGWQQRRKVEGPKKIEEVHRDAVQELHGQGGRSRGTNMGHSGRRLDHGVRGPAIAPYMAGAQMGSLPHMGGIKAPQPHMGPRDRGFTSQDARIVDRAQFENRSMPSSSTHRASDDGHLSLGPQGGPGKGIGGRAQPLPYAKSALADIPPFTSLSSRRTGAGPISGCNSDRMPVGMRDEILTRTCAAEKPLFAKSCVQERNVLDNDRREFKNSYSSGDRGGKTANAEFQLQEHSSQRTLSSQLSEVQLRKKAEMAIEEYYSVRDLKEAAFCVDDLKAPLFHSTMVSLWMLDSFVRKDVEVDLLGNLLTHLCKSEPFLLNRGQLTEGLQYVLFSLEDAIVDAPKAPEFLGRILAKLVVEGIFFIQDIARAIKDGGTEPGSLLENGRAIEVLGTVLEDIKRLKGEPVLSALYSKSGVHLESFMPKKRGDFEGFLKKKSIQCLYPVGISRHM